MNPLQESHETENHIVYKSQYGIKNNIDITVHSPINGSNEIVIFANDHLVGKLLTYEVVESDMTFTEAVEDLLWRANVGR